MFRKIFAVVAALLMLVSLAGCEDTPAVSDDIDYGYVEGYYSDLAHEVKTSGGLIIEQMYFLCTDPEFKNPVGKKDVYFDDNTGKMNKYVVTMGVYNVEQITTYTEGDNNSKYYSDIYFDEDENMTRVAYENIETASDGAVIRVVGEECYYPGGAVKKSLHLEEYRDGELTKTTDCEYDEEGNMTSEVIE